MSCIFCRIAAGEIPAEKVLENDQVVAFHDLDPKAPTHLLVIPKRHIVNVAGAAAGDGETLGAVLLACGEAARLCGVPVTGVIEMRRAEDGIRSWMAEGGEYYHSFTGELGGMWRRMGRAPQSVAGTGMTAQGFDVSTYFERTPDSFNERVRFMFEGIGATEP